MSGGGGSTNTIQSATPWSGVQPYLNNLYSGANTAFQAGGPQVYSGSEVSPLNSTQNQALAALASQGMGGAQTNLNQAQNQALTTAIPGAQGTLSGELADQSIMNGTNASTQQLAAMGNGSSGATQQLAAMGAGMTGADASLWSTANGTSAADQSLYGLANGSAGVDQGLTSMMNGTNASGQFLQSMLNPGYLNVSNNAALQNAMNAANYNTTFNYSNAVMPALNSQYSAAGRFGSGAMGSATNQANNTLATQISNTNAGMTYADLQQLMANQLQAGTTLGSQEQGAASTLGSLQANAGNALGSLQNSAASNLGSLENSANSSLASAQNTANQSLGNLQLGATGNFNATQGAYAQMLPSLGQMGMSNASTALGAGNQQQSQAQNLLSSQINQYNAQQQLPYSNINWLGQILAGANAFGTTSSSGTNANTANPYSTALGAGTLGLGAYNSGLLGSAAGSALGGAGLFSSTAGLTGAALDAALASSASAGVGAGLLGGGTSALMGLAAM